MRRGVNNNNDGWFGHNRWTYGTGSGSQISTAKLLKTGQTISYATNDDGDLEIGRDDSFLVLAENNPFGNTDRFTAPDGTQTYMDDIVIDWSTYDGAEVLGYCRTPIGTANWENSIIACTALSVGGFTSGWRMWNPKEYQNIMNFGGTLYNLTDYSPININSIEKWTSATLQDFPTYAYTAASYDFNAEPKEASLESIAVRTFTVTGTNLT